uniref:Uncharacterized protein n=1 Tax=Ditylenchus dipsaci TaxID=166011 RepID=A0A915DNF7_9BILA
MSVSKAPDVIWNGPFKAELQELYNIWIMNEDRMEWTKNGNRRPASMDVYLEWICISWESQNCRVTVFLDRSEDNLIHCFKEHGQVPQRRSMLQDARAWLEVERWEAEEIDPDQDEENGYLSDDSFDFQD